MHESHIVVKLVSGKKNPALASTSVMVINSHSA